MTYSHTARLTCSFAIAAAAMFGATAATADMSRLGAAGELNTLVHKSAASVCMITADVAVEGEMRALAQTRHSFNVLLEMLAEKGLSDETRAIEAAWTPTDVATSMILAGDQPADYNDQIMAQRPQLEFATVAFLSEAAASHNASVVDAITVDLAERQQVLIQQMKLQACQMLDGDTLADAKADLMDTMSVFEATLGALTDGDTAMGILVSDDYAINQVLAATAYDWQDMKPILMTIVDNGAATAEDLTRLQTRAQTVDTRVATLTELYFTSVHGEIDIPRVALLQTDAN